jgi:DNA helicase IV
MEWKRAIHREHGTVLVETYSYDRREGGLSRALYARLAPYVTLAPLPPEQLFDRLNELGQVDSFTRTLGTFLRHFKGARKTIADCEARPDEGKDGARASAFLELFARVYDAYQTRLDTRVDFEDMINRATDLVKSGRYKSPFKHLLVDEFQDISAGRAELLLALKAQHADARIFAVGDDWQAIYRFAGADIHLMRAFGTKFGGNFAGKTDVHAVVDLGRTFRSVDRIALPARHFVLRNPAQIEKQVKSAGTAQTAAIRIAWCDRAAEDAQLEQVLASLNAAANGAKKSTVLLLGRYRFLQPSALAALSRKFSNLTLRFLTIHSSKGLEADHVIILGMRAGDMGMPSERIDDPILNLVLPTPELFRHAEERRVFYVALTRAKASVTLIAQRQSPSSFVRELLAVPEYGVEDIGGESGSAPKCPTCGGPMKIVSRASGNWLICEHERLCGTKLPTCQSCGVDYPKVIGPGMMACSCGETPPACPKCNAWLVPRKGKFSEFYGCATYPICDGKAQVSKGKGRASPRA